MELVDSHCHLHNAEYFPGKAESYLERAAAAGVQRVVVIGTSPEDALAACEFARGRDGVYWTYGVHPEACARSAAGARNCKGGDAVVGRDLLCDDKLIAIGEVGLDYHYGAEDYAGVAPSDEELHRRQWRLLEEMLELGLERGLPFSFHVREAFEDFFAILDNFADAALRGKGSVKVAGEGGRGAGRFDGTLGYNELVKTIGESGGEAVASEAATGGIRGVIHSFSDNKKNLRRALERGFYIGVNGMATYSTLPRPPLERVLLETDAPFLAPVPHRGERNEPAYVRCVAEWAAEAYAVPFAEVAEVTTRNFEELFGMKTTAR